MSKLNLFSLLFSAPAVLFALFSALVIPAGFEPTTHSLEGCCSIQLSYGTIVKSSKSNTKFPITQTFRARFDFYCCASATWRGITHSRHLSIIKTLYYTQTQNKGCQTLRLAALLANMLPRTSALATTTHASCPSGGGPYGHRGRLVRPLGAYARAQPIPRASATALGATTYTCWS